MDGGVPKAIESRFISPEEVVRLLAETELAEARLVGQENARNATAPATEPEVVRRPSEPAQAEIVQPGSDAAASWHRNKWVGVVALCVTSAGLAVAVLPRGESTDNCTSETKIEVEGGKTWKDISEQVTNLTGFTVSDARLEQANPDKTPVDGEMCLNLPAPIVGGQLETSAQMTLKDIANASGESLETLVKLNKQIVASADEPIPKGVVVWLKPELNKNVALQPYDGQSLSELTGGTGQGLVDFVTTNAATLASQDDLGLKQDKSYLLPVKVADGPKLKAHEITTEDVIQAQPDAYDPAKRKKPEQPVQTSPSPGSTSEAINPATGLTPSQERIVASLPRTAPQKEFMTKGIAIINRLEVQGKLQGVNKRVMLMMAILESGWGSSDKAVHHNYFGMKAGPDWKGARITLRPNGTDPATGQPYEPVDWRAFTSMEEGFLGYIQKLIQSAWYQDALNQPTDAETVKGLLNEVGPNREIIRPGYLAWTNGPTYGDNILSGIKDNRIGELLPDKPLVTAKAPEVGPKTRRIDLDSSKYSNKDQVGMWIPSTPVRVGNAMLSPQDLNDMGIEGRLSLIETTLNQVRVSAAGFATFEKNILDLRPTIASDPFYANFNSKTFKDGTPYGKPNSLGEVSCLLSHLMAIKQSAVDDLTPIELARSMQNGGNGVAVQMEITREGQLVLLTDNYTQHAKNNGNGTVYNGKAYGVEVAATSQDGITAKQYEAVIYAHVRFLRDGGFIKKGEPFTAALNARSLGHGEVNNMLEGGHNDFNTILMDQAIRPYIHDVLIDMGYTA